MNPTDLSHLDDSLLPPKAARGPLTSATSKLSRLRQEAKSIDYSGCSLPLHVKDPVAMQLLCRILGAGGLQSPVTVGTLSPLACLQQVRALCKQPIQACYLVGSAASAVAGRRLLRKGLSSLVHQLRIPSPELFAALERRVQRCGFPFHDVDLQIECADAAALHELKEALQSHAWPQELDVRIDAFDQDHFILLKLKDARNDTSLDISIFSRRKSLYLVTRDALRVHIPEDPSAEQTLHYDCVDSWGWWRGHVLRLLERDAQFETSHHVFPRVLNLIGSKQVVTSWGLEDRLYEHWSHRISDGCVERLFQDVQKQGREHESCALGRQVAICRFAAVLSERNVPKLTRLLKQLCRPELDYRAGNLFLEEAIRLLPYGSVAILELAGLIALHEGWSAPFSVKLERMDEQRPVMRLRFCLGTEQRDLILRYDPKASLEELERKSFDWAVLRPLLHLLWQSPVRLRKQERGYQASLVSLQPWTTQLKASVFTQSSMRLPHGFSFSQYRSLAALILRHSEDAAELGTLAALLVTDRAGTPEERATLFWKVIEQLERQGLRARAAELIIKARRRGWAVPGGSDQRFCEVLVLPSPSLWEAYAPLELDTAWGSLKDLKPAERRKAVLAKLDSPALSAARYLAMAKLLNVQPSGVSAALLCRLGSELSLETWAKWLRSQWRSEEQTDRELCQALTESLLHCVKQGSTIPFPTPWLLDFLSSSQRFLARIEEKELIFEALAESALSAEQQERLLSAWQLRSPRLWGSVVQAYLLQQQDSLPEAVRDSAFENPQQFLAWCAVLRLDDAEHVQNLLCTELMDAHPPGGREMIAVAWLAASSSLLTEELLETLLPESGLKSKHWKKVLNRQKETVPYSMLRQLISYKRFSLATRLFLTIKPHRQKHEYLYREWAQLLEEAARQAPEQLCNAQVLSCLRLHPTLFYSLVLKRLPATACCVVVHRIGLGRKDLNILELNTQLEAALKREPTGSLALDIDQALGRKNSSGQYRRLRCCIAMQQLTRERGDLHYALTAYRESASADMHAVFPGQQVLRSLLRLGALDWLVGILQLASREELKSLQPSFFTDLIERCPRVEMRSVVLLHAPEDAGFLCAHWQRCVRGQELALERRVSLLSRASQFQVRNSQLLAIAQDVLGQVKGQIKGSAARVSQELRDFLRALLARQADRNAAFQLWCQIEHKKACSRFDLVSEALRRLEGGPLPDQLVEWLFTANRRQERERLLGAVAEQATAWTQGQLERWVLPFLHQHPGAAKAAFWALIKESKALALPSIEEFERFAPLDRQRGILTQFLKVRLGEFSLPELQRAGRLCLRYQLELKTALLQELHVRHDASLETELLQISLAPNVSEPAPTRRSCSVDELLSYSAIPEFTQALQQMLETVPEARRGFASYRLLEEQLAQQADPQNDEVFGLLRGLRVFPTERKQSSGRSELEQFCVRFLTRILPRLSLDNQHGHLVFMSDLLIMDRKIGPDAQRDLRELLLPYLKRFTGQSARSACMRLLLGAACDRCLKRDRSDAEFLLAQCNEHWIIGGYEPDIRDIIQAQLISYCNSSSYKLLGMSKIGYLKHRLGYWAELSTQQRSDLFCQFSSLAVTEAVANASVERLLELVHYTQDLCHHCRDAVPVNDQRLWCDVVLMEAIDKLPLRELLEVLPELLVPFASDLPDEVLADCCPWVLSNATHLLNKQPELLQRVLDTLAERCYRLLGLDLSASARLLTVIDTARSKLGPNSALDADIEAVRALCQRRLEQSSFELKAPAHSAADASVALALPDLFKQQEDGEHRYARMMKLNLSANFLDEVQQLGAEVDSEGLPPVIFGTQGSVGLFEQLAPRSLRLLASCIRTSKQLSWVDEQLAGKLPGRTHALVLAFALALLKKGRDLPSSVIERIQQHSNYVGHQILHERQSRFMGPLGVSGREAKAQLRRAFHLAVYVLGHGKGGESRAGQALKQMSDAIIQTKMDAYKLVEVIEDLVIYAGQRALVLCSQDGRRLLPSVLRLFFDVTRHALNFPAQEIQQLLPPISRLYTLLEPGQLEFDPYLAQMRTAECYCYTGIPHPNLTQAQAQSALDWLLTCATLQPDRAEHFRALERMLRSANKMHGFVSN